MIRVTTFQSSLKHAKCGLTAVLKEGSAFGEFVFLKRKWEGISKVKEIDGKDVGTKPTMVDGTVAAGLEGNAEFKKTTTK